MEEKRIEDAAEEYAVKSQYKSDFPHDYDSVKNGFIAGAKWATENKWHDATKELPDDNEQVIGRYFYGCEDHSCHDDKIVYCQTNGKDWFTDFGGIAFDIDKPDMWMPIPSLPEKLK